MPQRDFARKIGVAQSTIMRIENLDQNVTIDTLESLCKVFHADVADLFPRMDTSREYTAPPGGLYRPTRASGVPLVHEDGPEHDKGRSDADRHSADKKKSR
jgi:DNA-binding XRE family transcriptional regulator